MIIPGSKLLVADNCGAKLVECIGFLGNSVIKWAEVGDIITVVVKSAIPNGKVLKAQKYKAVIVRTKSPLRRSDGSLLKFDTNAAVLINTKGEMIGSRVFGPVPRYELREKAFLQILSLAPEAR
jgi:large subunit ribosomal protein L14